MKKNIIIILLILLVPLAAYFCLTRDRLTTPPSVAASGAEVIKFSSPMCYECQELEKVFENVFPKYKENINLKVIDVTNRDNSIQALIKQYNVTLVPTTVFKKSDGSVTRRIEGCMKEEVLENYLKELING
ncbi:thioredoxin family protein [bacterium]|nr:thioredoxin family protein [bacterium]